MNGLMPITYQTLTKTAMMMTTIRSVTAHAEDTTSPVIVYESPWQPKNISNLSYHTDTGKLNCIIHFEEKEVD